VVSSGDICEVQNALSDRILTAEVYRYPLQSEIAVRPETQNVYGSVKYTNTGSGYIGSSAVTTNTRTPLTVTNLQSYASYIGRARPCSDSNRVCIRFENLPAGDYEAFFTGSIDVTNGGEYCFFSISDGTSYVPPEIALYFANSSVRWGASYNASFSYNNTQTREFYVTARKYSGSGGCRIDFDNGSDITGQFQLGLRPLSQSIPAPNLVGSVTSLSADSLRIESVEISDCVGSNTICNITNKTSDWIQQIQRSTMTGEYIITHKPNVFRSDPICTCSPGGYNPGCSLLNNGWLVLRAPGGGTVDGRFKITCIGPRGSL
jgi:hypothetical protein